MVTVQDPIGPEFFHKLVQSAKGTLIRSTCQSCGAQQDCSAGDSSVNEWEQRHWKEHIDRSQICA